MPLAATSTEAPIASRHVVRPARRLGPVWLAVSLGFLARLGVTAEVVIESPWEWQVI